MMSALTISRVSLDELGLLQISGEQCLEFLQGQLSCDVREVQATQSRLGVHCSAKGRVLATFRLFYLGAHYYLLLPRLMINFLLKDLSKYAPFYKVTLKDATQSFQITGLVGMSLAKTLEPILGNQLTKNGVIVYRETEILVVPSTIPRVILLNASHALYQIATQTKPFAYWEMLDINTGIATVYPQTRERFTAHHLNYHKQGGISFTKGCYTGQEIIARMHYLGKLTQQLYTITFNSPTPLQPGADITDQTGALQGTLVMSVSQTEGAVQPMYQALALIQDAAIEEPLYLEDILIQVITDSVVASSDSS
jgi:tRNA-modifying protein YgfZ